MTVTALPSAQDLVLRHLHALRANYSARWFSTGLVAYRAGITEGCAYTVLNALTNLGLAAAEAGQWQLTPAGEQAARELHERRQHVRG